MWYVLIGLMVGGAEAEATFGDFLSRNLLPVVLGNFIGGALMVGLAQFLAYDANGLKARTCGCGAKKRNANTGRQLLDPSQSHE